METATQATLKDLPGFAVPDTVGAIIHRNDVWTAGWVSLRGNEPGLFATVNDNLWVRPAAPVFTNHVDETTGLALVISNGPREVAVWVPPMFYHLIQKRNDLADVGFPVMGVYVTRPEWVQ